MEQDTATANPKFLVEVVCHYRVYGAQMAEGVTPRLLAALQLGMDSYYKMFNLRTQVPECWELESDMV